MDLITYVVDDDEGARDSLIYLLRAEGMRCRAYKSAAEFLDQLKPGDRGCIITDVRMPGMDGLELIKWLTDLDCPMPVIVVTGHADVPLAVRALKAGVADFIEKPFEPSQILGSVRKCMDTVKNVENLEAERALIDHREALLTDREAQVYDAVSLGMSNKEVAIHLQISPRTVEIHRAKVMSKMEADSLSALVRMRLKAHAG